MSGNEALGEAIRQINPDVMPAFPITPSTEVTHPLTMDLNELLRIQDLEEDGNKSRRIRQ